MLADCKVCDLSMNCVKKAGFAIWSTLSKPVIVSFGFSMESPFFSTISLYRSILRRLSFRTAGKRKTFRRAVGNYIRSPQRHDKIYYTHPWLILARDHGFEPVLVTRRAI